MTSTVMQQGLLVLAHGSRDPAARAEYRRLAELVASRVNDLPVAFGVLEFPGEDLDSIEAALRTCVERGAQRIVALPYFLFPAGHVREDLPGELRSAAEGLGPIAIAYQPPLGVDPRLLNVLESRAATAVAGLPPAHGPTALLLVGAGTSDPDANADLFRAARLLWERRAHPLVEVGFVSLTGPSLPQALQRCRALGAARIVVVPYFLNTGVLSRRIAARLKIESESDPGVELVLAAEIGLHPELLDLLIERARVALAAPRSSLALPPCAQRAVPWACWSDADASGLIDRS